MSNLNIWPWLLESVRSKIFVNGRLADLPCVWISIFKLRRTVGEILISWNMHIFNGRSASNVVHIDLDKTCHSHDKILIFYYFSFFEQEILLLHHPNLILKLGSRLNPHMFTECCQWFRVHFQRRWGLGLPEIFSSIFYST